MEDSFHDIAQHLEDSLMIIDDLGTILYANPATSILYDGPIESLIGKKLSEAYPGGLGDRMFRAIQAAMNNGRLIVRSLTADLPDYSKLIDMRIYSSQLATNRKGAITISYEVTEREMLRKQTATIRREGALELLARRMAHELRNPLNTLGLNLELLEDELEELPEESKEEASDIISILQKQVIRLSEIVETYREVAKMPPLNLEEHDIKRIVTDLAHFFKGEALSKGIVIKVECNEDVPNLLIDANYIRETILNLILNAIEAMPKGGKLNIILEVKDDQVFIHVKDTGMGIKKEKQKVIFDLGYTTKKGGSGIGLSLVKHIVEQHGGKVFLESEPLKGTTFTLQLPCSRETKENTEDSGKSLLYDIEKFVFGIN